MANARANGREQESECSRDSMPQFELPLGNHNRSERCPLALSARMLFEVKARESISLNYS